MRTLNHADLQDLLDGACLLGSGGGGPRSLGQQVIDHAKERGTEVRVADPLDDVGDGEWMAVSAAVGSPEAMGSGRFPLNVVTSAFGTLEQRRNAKFAYILPGEIGAANSFVPLFVAIENGIGVVDASGARRAIPSLTMCTYAGRDVPISPLVLASQRGEVELAVRDAAAAEGPMRAIISQPDFGQEAGIAFWSMDGGTMKGAAIPRTLSYAQGLGARLRQSRDGGADPVQAVLDYLDGYLLFTGRIAHADEQTSGGFDVGRVVLRAEGSTAEVWIYNQNENLIAWDSTKDRPLAMAPDLICYLTTDGLTFSNADLQLAEGKEVAIIGARSTGALRQGKILDAFRDGLRGIGYAGRYVPIEELAGR